MVSNKLSVSIAALSALLCACNTFSTPEFSGETEVDAAEVDASATDAATDAAFDLGSGDGGDSDAARVDSGTDAGDAGGSAETNWQPVYGPAPFIDVMTFPAQLSVCDGETIRLSPAVAGKAELHVDTLETANPSRGERFAVTYIDSDGTLKVELIAADNASAVSIFESEFVVRAPTEGAVVATATAGAQLIVAAVEAVNENVVLIQCSADGAVRCRHKETNIQATFLELGTRVGSVNLYVPNTLSTPTSIFEHTVRMTPEDLEYAPTGADIFLQGPMELRSIDYGVINDDVPTLAVAVEEAGGTFYRFATYRNQEWTFHGAVSSEVAADVNSPRATVRPRSNPVAWVEQSDTLSTIDVNNITFDLMNTWSHGALVGDGIFDWDFAPVIGGYIEAYVRSTGVLTVTVNANSEIAAADRVRLNVDQELALQRPTRIGVANEQVAVASTQGDSLVFFPLCARE